MNQVAEAASLKEVCLLEGLDFFENVMLEVVVEDDPLENGHDALDRLLELGGKFDVEGTSCSFFRANDQVEGKGYHLL